MKPILILVDSKTNQSISIRTCLEPQFQNPWHFHKELELVLILKGSGTYFIGDHIGHFDPGDLILLGDNLPHMIKNKIVYDASGKAENAEAIVVHFPNDFLGKSCLQVPEMVPILALLESSKRGIKVSKSMTLNIAGKIRSMLDMSPFHRILELLIILRQIAEDPRPKVLSSVDFVEKINVTQNKKLDRVYEFVMNNFSKPITLGELADVAHMNKTAFCKYFKDRTNKTCLQFVTEIRVNYAKRLLMEGGRQIAETGYECGFNNVSNFNRQFKKLTGESPGFFQKKFPSKFQLANPVSD